MREMEFVEWLARHPPADRRGDWAPFLDGWRFVGYARGPVAGMQFDARLFYSGAVPFTFAMSDLIHDRKVRLLPVERVLTRYALDTADKAFELLRIAGPVSLRVWIFKAAGLEAEDIDPWYSDEPHLAPRPLIRLALSPLAAISSLHFLTGQQLCRLVRPRPTVTADDSGSGGSR